MGMAFVCKSIDLFFRICHAGGNSAWTREGFWVGAYVRGDSAILLPADSFGGIDGPLLPWRCLRAPLSALCRLSLTRLPRVFLSLVCWRTLNSTHRIYPHRTFQYACGRFSIVVQIAYSILCDQNLSNLLNLFYLLRINPYIRTICTSVTVTFPNFSHSGTLEMEVERRREVSMKWKVMLIILYVSVQFGCVPNEEYAQEYMEEHEGVTYFGLLADADLKETIRLLDHRNDYLSFSLFEEPRDMRSRRRMTVGACLDISIRIDTLVGEKAVFADECVLFENQVVNKDGELSITQVVSLVHLVYNGDLNRDESQLDVEVLVYGGWHGTVVLHRCDEYRCPDEISHLEESEDDEEQDSESESVAYADTDSH